MWVMSRFGRLLRARFLPQAAGDLEWVKPAVFPPQVFASRTMKFAVVAAAERHGEFIADLAAERLALRKADVVRVDRPPGAHEAGL